MPVTLFDEQERASTQRIMSAIEKSCACAIHHIQPLICAAVAIGWIAFRLAWFKDHLCGLRTPIGQHDAEAPAKA